MNWYLIFERTSTERGPGATSVQGMAAGAGAVRAPAYRSFKCLLIVEARDWDHALEQAVKLTGRLGEYAAVPCEVFIPEMIEVRKQRKGE